MRITKNALLEFIPVSQRSKVYNPDRAVWIVGNIYCRRMAIQDLCTENCEDCRLRLIKAFNIEEANNPEALLTWQMKSALAQAQEDKQADHKYVIKKNRYGSVVPTSESPLEDLLNLIL